MTMTETIITAVQATYESERFERMLDDLELFTELHRETPTHKDYPEVKLEMLALADESRAQAGALCREILQELTAAGLNVNSPCGSGGDYSINWVDPYERSAGVTRVVCGRDITPGGGRL